MPLSRGHRLVLIPDHVVKDPPALIATLGENKVTRILLVPSLLAAMLDAEPAIAKRLPQARILAKRGRAVVGRTGGNVSRAPSGCFAHQRLWDVRMLRRQPL